MPNRPYCVAGKMTKAEKGYRLPGLNSRSVSLKRAPPPWLSDLTAPRTGASQYSSVNWPSVVERQLLTVAWKTYKNCGMILNEQEYERGEELA